MKARAETVGEPRWLGSIATGDLQPAQHASAPPRRSGRADVMSTAAEYVHHRFRTAVLECAFPCLGARSAIRAGAYRFGLYPEIGSCRATKGLARDLTDFLASRSGMSGRFHTFVASFAGFVPPDESAFERRLWEQLQRLHDHDSPQHAWDPTVSSDPAAPDFSFSFGGTALFVVGLHPGSSRRARRFAWPTLVFNPHDQFTRLRHQGKFARMQELIRRREIQLQGTLNPNLSNFGSVSDARQYSGRPVEPDWRCPFHARTS